MGDGVSEGVGMASIISSSIEDESHTEISISHKQRSYTWSDAEEASWIIAKSFGGEGRYPMKTHLNDWVESLSKVRLRTEHAEPKTRGGRFIEGNEEKDRVR